MNSGFVAGTLVKILEFPYLKPIEDIKVGDMVLSHDISNPQTESQYKPVLNTFKSYQKERICKVEYLSNEGMEYIFCHALHPFWATQHDSEKTGEWTAAEGLPGIFLVDLFGLGNILIMPISVGFFGEPAQAQHPDKDFVYNLEVADYHTYFIDKDAILVGDISIQKSE